MRIVADTNTLISGLFWDGPPRRILGLAREERLELCLNVSIMKEIARVLAYPKFGLSEEEIKPLLSEITSISVNIPETCTDSFIQEDPTDDAVLRCAVDAKAEYIVSGGHHILEYDPGEPFKIMRAKSFLDTFETR